MAGSDQAQLSHLARAFCAEYIAQGRNGTKAYMRVYPRSSEKAAAVGASRLLRNPNVAAEIERLTKESLKKSQLSADRVLVEMARLATIDPLDLVYKPGEKDFEGKDTVPGTVRSLLDMPEEIRRCISGIDKDKDGTIKFRFWDKNTALTNLAKHHKLLTDKLEVSGKVGLAERLKDARRRAGK